MVLAMFLASYASMALAQEGEKCHDADLMTARTTRICNEVIPSDGLVWFRTEQGGACYCECEELLQLPLTELIERRKARGEIYRSRIRAFNDSIQGMEIRAGGGAPQQSHGSEPAAPTCETRSDIIEILGDPICERDRDAIARLEEIDASDLGEGSELVTYFTYYLGTSSKISSDDCDDRFTVIHSGLCFPTIDLPSTLIRHPTVGDELLNFMLLHEMGHSLARLDDGSFGCEPNADVWAIEIGFNAIYGSAIGGAVAKLVAQLEDYHLAILGASNMDKPVGSRSCLNSYPGLPCRTGLIELAAGIGELTNDGIDAYINEATRSCWTGALTGSIPYIGEVYCDDVCGEELELADVVAWKERELFIEWLKDHRVLVRSAHAEYLGWEELYCFRNPEKCLKYATVLEGLPRDPQAPSLDKDFRKTIVTMDRSLRDLKKVHKKLEQNKAGLRP